MRIVTSAPNKIILCGEHFVVYGAPAIAIPTNNRNKIILFSRSGEPKITLRSNLGEAVYHSDGNFEGKEEFKIFVPAIKYSLKDKDIDETVEVEILHSGAPKGMGSSSSMGAALGLALLTYLEKSPSEKDIFECGQLVDEVAHGGKPSGIDARTTSRGRPQKFQKGFNPPQFSFEDIDLEFPEGSALIVADTFRGEREITGQLIERFAQKHGITKKPEEMPEGERRLLFADYLRVYEKFVSNCQKAGDPVKLGEAFDENYKLLFSVSTPEIEEVREIALNNGAYGSKLTGAGGKGGAVVILAPRENSKSIINELSKRGYPSFKVELASVGAKVEMVL